MGNMHFLGEQLCQGKDNFVHFLKKNSRVSDASLDLRGKREMALGMARGWRIAALIGAPPCIGEKSPSLVGMGTRMGSEINPRAGIGIGTGMGRKFTVSLSPSPRPTQGNIPVTIPISLSSIGKKSPYPSSHINLKLCMSPLFVNIILGLYR